MSPHNSHPALVNIPMKLKRHLLILLVASFVAVLAGYFISKSQLNNTPKLNTGKTSTHLLVFFDKDTFYSGIEKAQYGFKPFNYHIVGGITPHDLFAGFILADFYNRLSKQNPTTIILMGPNHYERGHFKVLTSLYGWQTTFGVVEPETGIINDLVKNNLAMVDEETLPNDHAVAGSMSFIKYYIPDAKVVPLLLSGKMTQDDADALANYLKSIIKSDVVVVAPVDFSHYLTNQQAQEKNKVTLKAMEDFDYRQIFSFTNDYLDSPPSIATLLMVMQKMGITHTDLLNNTNSGLLQNNDFVQTTSYFEIAYY